MSVQNNAEPPPLPNVIPCHTIAVTSPCSTMTHCQCNSNSPTGSSTSGDWHSIYFPLHVDFASADILPPPVQPPPVTPRAHRHAEVRNNQAPDSPQRRRVPRPMQPQRPPMPPRADWAPRTVHPRPYNLTEHFRAELPPRSEFSSVSRTEPGSQCSRLRM